MHYINLIQQMSHSDSYAYHIDDAQDLFQLCKDHKKRKEPEKESTPEILGENIFCFFWCMVTLVMILFCMFLFVLQAG